MSPMRNYFGGNNNGMNMFGKLGNFMSIIPQFMQFAKDPVGSFMRAGFNMPQNVQNNPDAMVNYLRNSGQMTDEMYNQFSQMAGPVENYLRNNGMNQ